MSTITAKLIELAISLKYFMNSCYDLKKNKQKFKSYIDHKE